jgi:hypothetical protein
MTDCARRALRRAARLLYIQWLNTFRFARRIECDFFDAGFGFGELFLAVFFQCFTLFVELDRVFEIDFAAFELGDDVFELGQCFFRSSMIQGPLRSLFVFLFVLLCDQGAAMHQSLNVYRHACSQSLQIIAALQH